MSALFTDTPEQSLINDDDFHRFRAEIIGTLARWVVGTEKATPTNLVKFIKDKVMIPNESEISDRAQPSLGRLCEVMEWARPRTFSLHPVNLPACVMYWRVAVHLLKYLSQDLRRKVRRFNYVPAKPAKVVRFDPIDVVEPMLLLPSVFVEEAREKLQVTVTPEKKVIAPLELQGAVGGDPEVVPPPLDPE